MERARVPWIWVLGKDRRVVLHEREQRGAMVNPGGGPGICPQIWIDLKGRHTFLELRRKT